MTQWHALFSADLYEPTLLSDTTNQKNTMQIRHDKDRNKAMVIWCH